MVRSRRKLKWELDVGRRCSHLARLVLLASMPARFDPKAKLKMELCSSQRFTSSRSALASKRMMRMTSSSSAVRANAKHAVGARRRQERRTDRNRQARSLDMAAEQIDGPKPPRLPPRPNAMLFSSGIDGPAALIGAITTAPWMTGYDGTLIGSHTPRSS